MYDNNIKPRPQALTGTLPSRYNTSKFLKGTVLKSSALPPQISFKTYIKEKQSWLFVLVLTVLDVLDASF